MFVVVLVGFNGLGTWLTIDLLGECFFQEVFDITRIAFRRLVPEGGKHPVPRLLPEGGKHPVPQR